MDTKRRQAVLGIYLEKMKTLIPKHTCTPMFMLLFSHSVVSSSLKSQGLQHARLPCPSVSPRVCSISCPLSQWCYLFHPLMLSCPFAFSLSQHQGLFQWVNSLQQVAKVLPMNIQGWFPLGLTSLILLSKGLSESCPTPQFKNINSSALSFLYSPTLTSIHDYWKNHSFD